MTSTVLPGSPAPGARRPGEEQVRFVAVFADLMPEEVLEARRTRALKRRIVVGLSVVAAVLVLWYGFALWRTSVAQGDLDSARRTTAQLQQEQRRYEPLITAQTQSALIGKALTRLMVGDLQWKDMLDTLRSSARGGVTVTGVTGTISSGAASSSGQGSTAGLGVLNQTGKQQVGTLTVNGTAPDKNSVAAYVDTLAKVPGLAAPFPASVTGTGGKLTFAVNVIITSDALGGRYAPQTTAPGGK